MRNKNWKICSKINALLYALFTSNYLYRFTKFPSIIPFKINIEHLKKYKYNRSIKMFLKNIK